MTDKEAPSSRNAPDDASYDVGYGKPPRHTRFKPGVSGNPKGRPKGHLNITTIIKETAREKVSIRQGQKTSTVPKLSAFVQLVFNKALAGDPRAATLLLKLLQCAGLNDEVPESAANLDVSTEDRAILENFLARHGMRTEPEDERRDGTEDQKVPLTPQAGANESQQKENS
jgi:hypothetical protein